MKIIPAKTELFF